MADHSDFWQGIIKIAVDTAAVGVVCFTFIVKILPPLAAAFSVFWGFTRAYEAITGRKFSTSKMAKFIRHALRMDS